MILYVTQGRFIDQCVQSTRYTKYSVLRTFFLASCMCISNFTENLHMGKWSGCWHQITDGPWPWTQQDQSVHTFWPRTIIDHKSLNHGMLSDFLVIMAIILMLGLQFRVSERSRAGSPNKHERWLMRWVPITLTVYWLATERTIAHHICMSVLQPRELDHSKTGQEAWSGKPHLQSVRATISDRNQLWVRLPRIMFEDVGLLISRSRPLCRRWRVLGLGGCLWCGCQRHCP